MSEVNDRDKPCTDWRRESLSEQGSPIVGMNCLFYFYHYSCIQMNENTEQGGSLHSDFISQ